MKGFSLEKEHPEPVLVVLRAADESEERLGRQADMPLDLKNHFPW
jgi:hypothetical protein